jgi:hypothetical protein
MARCESGRQPGGAFRRDAAGTDTQAAGTRSLSPTTNRMSRRSAGAALSCR